MWSQLDALAEQAPDIDRFYSVGTTDGVEPELRGGAWSAYQRRADAGRGGAGVSLHRHLATPERLRSLHDRGLRAICYTVNDLETGTRLLDLDAGGLTSDRADLIQRWQDRWASPD
jgi:glycerophosphoryl diester phosphodiesterase